MPRITASGHDVGVGSKVTSTPVDSSKGMGTTLPQKFAPASSCTVSDAGNVGGGALINKPPPKFDIKKLAIKRAYA